MPQSTANATGNLVRLSDIFCRNVQFQPNHDTLENLVKLGREFVDEFVSYADAYQNAYFNAYMQGDDPDNISLDFNDFMKGHIVDILNIMNRMDRIAYKAGLTSITLPFVYQSEAGKWIHKEIIKQYNFTHTKFLLLPAKYDEDNRSFGEIHEDLEEETMLWLGDEYTLGPLFAVDLTDDMQSRFVLEQRYYGP